MWIFFCISWICWLWRDLHGTDQEQSLNVYFGIELKVFSVITRLHLNETLIKVQYWINHCHFFKLDDFYRFFFFFWEIIHCCSHLHFSFDCSFIKLITTIYFEMIPLIDIFFISFSLVDWSFSACFFFLH